MSRGKNIAVIPAGEKWEDGTLRPSFEDLAGAGAIIQHLRGTRSPEANLAVAAFESACPNLLNQLKSCSSGKEKLSRGEEMDLILAAELKTSDCVPILTGGVYKKEA